MFETLAGWQEPLDGSPADDLPAAARRYVEFVERELDVPVALVGTGAERAARAARAMSKQWPARAALGRLALGDHGVVELAHSR